MLELKIDGLDGVLKTLQSLPAEVVSKNGGPVKLSLAKGARMLRDAARDRVAQIVDPDDSTGLLAENIVNRRGKMGSEKGEKQVVTVRRKSYEGRDGEVVTTRKTAQILEYGSKKQQATPWLRPAAEANASKIITIVSDDLVKRVDKIVKKLQAQNK